MACADISMDIQHSDEADHDYEEHGDEKRKPLIKYYQPSELIPAHKGPIHDLLLKQPAVLGSLQMISGFLSVGLGFVFAATDEPTKSLLTLLRVAPVTGILFFIAGLLANLLFKYPRLLPACLLVNMGSMVVALVGAVLIVVDLALWNSLTEHNSKLEVLVLCVLLEEVIASAVLSFWIHKTKPIHDL